MLRAALVLAAASAGVPNLDQWDENAQRAYDALRHAPLPSTPPVQRKGEGVVYAVGGSEEFFDQEVVPCVRHLTRLETSDGWRHLTTRTLKFMLFHERRQTEFKKWDLVQNFFDATEAFEDAAPSSMTRQSDPRIRVKSVKAWAFYRAPFERFVYLDFDSRPCSWHAPSDVLAKLRESGRDALLPVWKSNLRHVRAESSCRPPRYRRDACSMAWRCRLLTARRGQHGRVIAEKCTRHTG